MDLDSFERVFREPVRFGPHTIEAPVRYEVWRDFAVQPKTDIDLLLEPKSTTDPNQLGKVLLEGLNSFNEAETARPAVADDAVLVTVSFRTFLRVVLPLTDWADLVATCGQLSTAQLRTHLAAASHGQAPSPSEPDRDLPDGKRLPRDASFLDTLERLRWFLLLVARIGTDKTADASGPNLPRYVRWLRETFEQQIPSALQPIRCVNINRQAQTSVIRSRGTVKADAAQRLFELDASGISWAVLDSGIEARHPAFRARDAAGVPYQNAFEETPAIRWEDRTRVVRTYDFVHARDWLEVRTAAEAASLDVGARIEEFGRVNHLPLTNYRPPYDVHGSHVAGVLASDWPTQAEPLIGICPQLKLYDFRVLGPDGRGSEFSILTALNHVRRINETANRIVIAGVNLSLSLPHDVANYACGWTPICEACNRLVDSGVVVVVAAGNTGFRSGSGRRMADGTTYLPISITDPGNADNVITVGATHREFPYRYGVSYFSARGPTADGRRKPDLLAPGEGIVGPVGLDERLTLDGTSQAAPHVSGAAALLMARYPELIGNPTRVKRILCESATDLGRDRAFQGDGLVDVLRALQAV